MILVTGATGNVGAEVVPTSWPGGQRVRALVRRSGRPGLPPGVEAVTGDLNGPGSLSDALNGVRGVFLLPGYGTCGLLADAAGPGSSGSCCFGRLGRQRRHEQRRHAVHAPSEAAGASGIPWTILRPARSCPTRCAGAPSSRPATWCARRSPRSRSPSSTRRHRRGRGAGAARGHEGRIYVLTGPESLLPADQVRILAEVLGRDLRCEAQPNEEARAQMTSHASRLRRRLLRLSPTARSTSRGCAHRQEVSAGSRAPSSSGPRRTPTPSGSRCRVGRVR